MMTRNQFLRSLAGVGASVVGAVVLVGCKDDDGSSLADAPGAPDIDAAATPIDAPMTLPDAPPTMSTCTTNVTTISTNHGHAITVAAADIVAGVDKTYNIKGGSAHPHTVMISAAMFTMLKAGMSVMVTSSLDAGHTHSVMVTCS